VTLCPALSLTVTVYEKRAQPKSSSFGSEMVYVLPVWEKVAPGGEFPEWLKT
jgi:hypothetical protein